MKTILLIITFLLFFFFSAFSQINVIDIKNFSGVITNADIEDLNPEYLTVLKNLRSINGKLVKTFEFGFTNWDTISNVDNFATYIESHLTNPDGRRNFIYSVISDTVFIKYWDTSTENWEDLSLSENFYHKDAKNPIIQESGIIRILPGNVDTLAGGNECKGIWYGYIDRDYFDEHYNIDSGYYKYTTDLDEPIFIDTYEHGTELENKYIDTSTVMLSEPTSFLNDETYYYKFSYIYDGIQESLLSDLFKWEADSGRTLLIDIPIKESEHNCRITAIKVYRSEIEDGVYNHINTIDLLRKETDFFGCDSGAYPGKRNVFIPELATYDFVGDTFLSYKIELGGSERRIFNEPSQNGDSLYSISEVDNFTTGIWNGSWELIGFTNIDGEGDSVENLVSNSTGGYGGDNTIIINKPLSGSAVIGSQFTYNKGLSRVFCVIYDYWSRVVWIDDNNISTVLNDAMWNTLVASNGNYIIENYATYDSVDIIFVDNGLTEGAEHPLADEVSIKVNGQFAKIIGGRLWQANIVLDPGDANEVHTDWVSYSEIGQYDVNPVSNVISFANEGIGEITGLGELFGNPVIMKKNNLSLIDITSSITPENWQIIESIHNIGNIAINGSMTLLGKLYVCYYDGIYEFRPNDLAESASTPTKRLKITEPIEDTYLELTLAQKENIISEYNQNTNEILFVLGDEIWGYNINNGYWREIDCNIIPTLLSVDNISDVIGYKDDSFYAVGVDDTVGIELKTKMFVLDDEVAKSIARILITYKSATDLTLNIFTEYNDTVRVAKTIPASNRTTNHIIGNLGVSVKKFQIGIIDSLNSNTNTEINRIKILY